MIHFDHVSHHFAKRPALRDLSFTLEPGRIYGFVGPNGAGKTTTFRICSGALRPTVGKLDLFGAGTPDQPEIRRRIGYLPERNPLFEEPDVLEHLSHVAGLRGLRSQAKREAMKRAIERCQLGPVLPLRVHALSKGYRQRLGLACAIMHEPDLLILDEPINGLDPQQIQSFIELLPELAQDRTLVFSSHILAHLDGVCDQILMLHRGQLIFNGSPQAWFERDPKAGLHLEIGAAADTALPLLRSWAQQQGDAQVTALEASHHDFHAFHISGNFAPQQRAELAQHLAQHQIPLANLGLTHADSDRVFKHLIGQNGGDA